MHYTPVSINISAIVCVCVHACVYVRDSVLGVKFWCVSGDAE